MTERKVRVTSDTWVSEAAPNNPRGRHREIRVRAGAGSELIGLLWAKVPWDAQETVFVGSQTLRLTVAEDTTAAAELYVRALSRRFDEHNVTWNRKPGVTGPTATKTVGVLAAGDTVDIDITAIGQNIAGGQRNKGLRLSTNSTTRIRFHSSESRHRPVIITEWADEPSAPRVRGVGLISRQFPVFKFDYEEADGDLSAVRLQIDAAADGVTPDFDSGLVPATEALLDTSTHSSARSVTVSTTLNSTALTAAAGTFDTTRDPEQAITGPGIPAGATLAAVTSATAATLSAPATASGTNVAATITRRYLGLADLASTKVRGSIVVSGIESPMGDWETVTRRVKGSLIPSSPAAGVANSPTPTLLADFTSPNGEVLTEQRIRVYNAARTKILYDTGREPSVDGDTIAATVPRRWKGRRVLRRKGTTYSVRFDAFGDTSRVHGPADPAAVTEWVDFTVTHGAITAPSGFTATASEGLPWADLAFTIGIVPDEIAVAVNDDIVAILEPAVIHAGGTSYAYRLAALPPFKDAEVKVAQIVDGQMSPWSTPQTVRIRPHGVWVVDQETGEAFKFHGLDVGDWTFTDQGAYYDPAGSPYQVRVVTAQQGMTGTLTGALRDNDALTYAQQLANAWAIKPRTALADYVVQVVAADWSIPVKLDDLSPGPHPDYYEDQPAALVSARFRQVDDFPFESVL